MVCKGLRFKAFHLQIGFGMLQIPADDLLHGPVLTHLCKGVHQLLCKTAVIIGGKGCADSGDQQRLVQNAVSWPAMAST